MKAFCVNLEGGHKPGFAMVRGPTGRDWRLRSAEWPTLGRAEVGQTGRAVFFAGMVCLHTVF